MSSKGSKFQVDLLSILSGQGGAVATQSWGFSLVDGQLESCEQPLIVLREFFSAFLRLGLATSWGFPDEKGEQVNHSV